jgi:hypothetical protein
MSFNEFFKDLLIKADRYIRWPEHQTDPIKPTIYQEEISNSIDYYSKAVYITPRQQGLSTLGPAYALYSAITSPDRDVIFWSFNTYMMRNHIDTYSMFWRSLGNDSPLPVKYGTREHIVDFVAGGRDYYNFMGSKRRDTLLILMDIGCNRSSVNSIYEVIYQTKARKIIGLTSEYHQENVFDMSRMGFNGFGINLLRYNDDSLNFCGRFNR